MDSGSYKVVVKHLDDANKFRPAAVEFEKNGRYTAAPKGTKEYRKYWSEQLRHSLDGYTSEDGDYISGYNYFYLNFCQIVVSKQRKYRDKRGYNRTKVDRIKSFPWFFDYDRAYFDAVDEAERQGKHLVVLKRRQAGYSYKNASMLCRNYYCIPESKSAAVASEMEFLTKDGIITKAWEMMDFIDQNTAFGKKRQKVDTKAHRRASIVKDIDGVKTEIGYKSEVMGVSMKNDPQKLRGKNLKLMLYEEGGHFPNVITTWQIARPSVEDDDGVAYGLMILFGTGSTGESDFEGLKDIFYNPEAYNCLEIENHWDEGTAQDACGFFVPQYYNMVGKDNKGNPFMDENGNSNIQAATEFILTERDKIIQTSSDRSAIDRYIIERPLNPQEACLSVTSNIFPKKELMAHLNEIRNSKSISDYKQTGDLTWDKNGIVKWELNPRKRDLVNYRLKPGEEREGAVVIWEHPVEDPPYGLYIAGIDPYDHDKSNTDSLGSIFIYKRIQTFEKFYDLPVAEYTGRPETANEFYETCRKLIKYYGATALYENEKKGLFTYFEHKHSEHLLADQPGTIKDVIKETKVQRGKGIHMNKEIKMWMEGLTKDWLNEEFSPGQKNLLKIYSEPLLEELINYNDEGNFDRVISFGLCMIYREELYQVKVKKKKDEGYRKMLFEKPLFTHNF